MSNTMPKVYMKYGKVVIAYEYEYQEYAGATYKKDVFEMPLAIEDVKCFIESLNSCMDETATKT